jgi:hypothetical protein
MNSKPNEEFQSALDLIGGKALWLKNTSLSRFERREMKFRMLIDQLKQFNPFDSVLYMRYPIADLSFLRFLNSSRNWTIVTEHQDKEAYSANFFLTPVRYTSEVAFGKAVRKSIDAFVGVTREIVDYEAAYVGSLNQKEVFVNGNGFDINSVPIRSVPMLDDRIKLLYVGSAYRPHALDRIIIGLSKYLAKSRERNVELHIVGESEYIKHYKKLVEKKDLKNLIHFHGRKLGKELDHFFSEAHIAIGSLGVHRKGLSETSELKLREYCARGIPFFCSVPDADFPDDFPYVLRVPSGEEPIDLKEILSFTKRVCSDQRHPQFMREYALANLDWPIKMKRLVEFLERIISSGGKKRA